MVQGIQDTKVMKHHNISDDDDLDNLNNFIVESPSNKVVNIRFKVSIFRCISISRPRCVKARDF